MKHLDFADPNAVAVWLEGLRQSFDDLAAVTADALRPLRRRQLGHVTHSATYRAAREQIRSALAYASLEPPEDPEPSDPAGSPGH